VYLAEIQKFRSGDGKKDSKIVITGKAEKSVN
jgi:hypothetical protein